jgi:hypothetical protein
MTDQELRIKVAELVGLTDIRMGMYEECEHCSPLQETLICTDSVGYRIPVPAYEEDLNAMHEAEEQSTIFQSWRDTERWLRFLSLATIGRACESEPDCAFVLRATARQRAEAFVKAMEGDKE